MIRKHYSMSNEYYVYCRDANSWKKQGYSSEIHDCMYSMMLIHYNKQYYALSDQHDVYCRDAISFNRTSYALWNRIYVCCRDAESLQKLQYSWQNNIKCIELLLTNCKKNTIWFVTKALLGVLMWCYLIIGTTLVIVKSIWCVLRRREEIVKTTLLVVKPTLCALLWR